MKPLDIVPIHKLLDEKFYIPFYQRGYRWTERQVLDLLEDILEFQTKKAKQDGEFYCLQPIVVSKHGEKWEVIDGQQRLTTVYLILLYLEDMMKIAYYEYKNYSIEYETRPTSEDFLKSKVKHIIDLNTKNIDFYHMSKAFLKIRSWFEKNIKNKRVNKGKFLDALLDPTTGANNVKFIWYEVKNLNSDGIDIFTRINMGKIPLTSAELIKALFFTGSDSDEAQRSNHQLKIAYLWDQIEYTLQDNNFWFFLNNKASEIHSRIEFIFDLIADKYLEESKLEIDKSLDKYFTFYVFNEIIRNKTIKKSDLWEEIKTNFRIFEEWYQESQFYHLIGFLIHQNVGIKKIIYASEHKSKPEFREFLADEIKANLQKDFSKKGISNLMALTYSGNNSGHDPILRKLLLLFNVITAMNSKFTRFPFNKYIKENWSLEHIHAQNSEDIKAPELRRLILNEQLKFYEKIKGSSKILAQIKDMFATSKIEDEEFNKLQDEIFSEYSDDFSIHTIDNMALLSKDDNSSLSNNIFPIKLGSIKKLDESGSFIPLCTKNVFLKYYTENARDFQCWTTEDRKSYFNELKKTISPYLPPEIADEDN